MTDDSSSSGGFSIGRRRFLQATGVATAALTVGAATAAGQSGSGRSRTDHTVESWDGTELATTLFTPAESSPQPAVLMTHGWGGNRGMEASNADRYARNGYVALAYDSRGFGDSDGVAGLNGPKEVKDGQALIDWLARRDEVQLDGEGDPRLGMDGYSYGGGIQPLLASADERVDAIIPRITWNDLQYSLAPNGAIKQAWARRLLDGGIAGVGGVEQLDPWLPEFAEQAIENNEVPPGFSEKTTERSFAQNHDGFDTPALLFQGWDDSLFNCLEAARTDETLQELGVDSRICFHRYGHTLPGGTVSASEQSYMNDLALSWLDKHLRGADVSIGQAHMYDKQGSRWIVDDAFPPDDVGMVTHGLDDADTGWRHRNRVQQNSGQYDIETAYPWTVRERTELYGTPRMDLTFDVHGPEAIVYLNLRHNSTPILGYGEAYRLSGSGTHSVQFDYPTLHRTLSAGHELSLEVSVSSDIYLDSAISQGVTVRPAESTVDLPVRDQNPGTGSGSSGTSGSGWWTGTGSGSSSGAGSGWW